MTDPVEAVLLSDLDNDPAYLQGVKDGRAARDAEVPRQEDFERVIAAGLDTQFVADIIEPLESGEVTLIARHLAIRCALLMRDYRAAILDADTGGRG